jgi:hypothetical protein
MARNGSVANGRWCKALSVVACAVAVCSVAGRAAAAEQDNGPASPVEDGGLGNHQKNIRLELGVRTQYIASDGFNPFSERDVLPQFTLGASWALWAKDKLSLAAFGGLDYGGTSADLRSHDASLDLVRFSLAPEARYHVLRVLALTAKVGPTLTRESAEISSPLGTPLLKTGWKFGFDATAGVAVEVWGYANGASNKPRMWVMGEGGYGWTAPLQLTFKPEESGAVPQRLTPLDLGELVVGGPLFRITCGLSFW